MRLIERYCVASLRERVAEAAQVAGEGMRNVEVEGGAVRSGGTSVEGDVAPRPRALRAAPLAARRRGLPPRPPLPVVLHVGGERKGRSGERGRQRRRLRADFLFSNCPLRKPRAGWLR